MKRLKLLIMTLLVSFGWSTNALAVDLDTVEDYMFEASEYVQANGSRYWGGTSSNEYILVGYTNHGGVNANWMCRAVCTNFDGTRCRSRSGGETWIRLSNSQPPRLNGNGGRDTMVGAPYNSFDPGAICDSSRGNDTWDPPTIPYLEMRGGSGDDTIIGPPGDIYTVLYGVSGDDYIENGSSHYRSFAFGGDYWCGSSTCYPSSSASADGDDSLMGAGSNRSTTTSSSADNLFGGRGRDCLADFGNGANRFRCGAGSDTHVPPQSGGESPVSCGAVVSECPNPY